MENLQNKPQDTKLRIAFLITLLASLVLVPVWLWNARRVSFLAGNAESPQAQNEGIGLNDIRSEFSSALGQIENPVTAVDNQLKEKFSQPFNIIAVQTQDESLVVHFSVSNSTFSDLVVPVARVYLKSAANAGSVIPSEKVTTDDGKNFAAVVLAGENANGTIYFSQVVNGAYQLVWPGLYYSADERGQTFEQTLDLEVIDSWSLGT